MSKRNNVKKTYLSDAEAKQLSEWADEVDKSESALLREAVLEYLDHDRTARLEAKVDEMQDTLAELQGQISDGDTHTHTPDTPMNGASDSTEKARDIVRRIQSNHGEVVKDGVVVRAIEDIAGADDRTIRKYKSLVRKRGLLFEHPGESPVWTTESDQWLSWMEDYARLNGRDEVERVAEEYPAQITANFDGKLRIELTEEQ